MELDRSAHDRMEVDIFEAIIQDGITKTSYDLVKKGFKIATILRHLDDMRENGLIQIYEQQLEGRPKIKYGPTMEGLRIFSADFQNIFEQLDIVVEKWLKYEKFQKQVALVGDFKLEYVKQNPEEVQKTLKKFFSFNKEITDLSYEEEILEQYKIQVGSMLFGLKKPEEHLELGKELYVKMPSFRNGLKQSFLGSKIMEDAFEKIEQNAIAKKELVV